MAIKRPGIGRRGASRIEEPARSCLPGCGRVVVLITSVLLGFGCGRSEPLLDACNDATLDASLDSMTSRMSQEEKLQFVFDCLALMDAETSDRAMKAGGVVAGTKAFQPIQGMTAVEIRARAESLGQLKTSDEN